MVETVGRSVEGPQLRSTGGTAGSGSWPGSRSPASTERWAYVDRAQDARLAERDRTIAAVERNLDALEPLATVPDELEVGIEALRSELEVLEGFDRARTCPIRVLAGVQDALPDRARLGSLPWKDRKLVLTIRSPGPEVDAAFLRELDRLPQLAGVEQLHIRGHCHRRCPTSYVAVVACSPDVASS